MRENSRYGREGLSKDVVFKLKSAPTGRSGGGAVQEAGLGTWPTQLEKVERESEA